jgi:hypothetical protein
MLRLAFWNKENMMTNFPKPDPLAGLTEILPSGAVKPPSSEESEFITDTWLAEQLQMAVATVRSQRFKRLHGEPHWLDIDPIYIGSKPRYRRIDALDWLSAQASKRRSI